jgi:hypothetical protein|tara:strand:+ start:115 stop:318 length:204 start_codon:yes stop_codon:yes gene_type:complete
LTDESSILTQDLKNNTTMELNMDFIQPDPIETNKYVEADEELAFELAQDNFEENRMENSGDKTTQRA